MIHIEHLTKMPATTHLTSIYFLMLGEVVVYVGQSINYTTRIGQHKKEGAKNFDSFKVVELKYGVNADFVEFCEIANRKPIYNTQLTGLDFLMTKSDIRKHKLEAGFDLELPDYTVLMVNRIFEYWKVAGFEGFYAQLDLCKGLIKAKDIMFRRKGLEDKL
jgi:hypothetical protein